MKKKAEVKTRTFPAKEGILRRGTKINMCMSFIFNDQLGKIQLAGNRVENKVERICTV